MKYTVIIFSIFSFSISLKGQIKEKESLDKSNIAFSIITGAHFNTINKQFNNLNTSLMNRDFPTISPIFNSIGVGLVFKSNKSYSFSEFTYLYATHDIEDRTIQYRLVPKITGYNFKTILTSKLWEKKKTRLDGGLGLSISNFNFKLVDRLPVQIPFDTLLKSPITASGALDYTQLGYNWHLDGRLMLTYSTHWFKNMFDIYDFTVSINYSQSIINPKDWVVSDTRIKVPNFPTLNFSNMYIQFTNNVHFSLRKK